MSVRVWVYVVADGVYVDSGSGSVKGTITTAVEGKITISVQGYSAELVYTANTMTLNGELVDDEEYTLTKVVAPVGLDGTWTSDDDSELTFDGFEVSGNLGGYPVSEGFIVDYDAETGRLVLSLLDSTVEFTFVSGSLSGDPLGEGEVTFTKA